MLSSWNTQNKKIKWPYFENNLYLNISNSHLCNKIKMIPYRQSTHNQKRECVREPGQILEKLPNRDEERQDNIRGHHLKVSFCPVNRDSVSTGLSTDLCVKAAKVGSNLLFQSPAFSYGSSECYHLELHKI